MSKEESRDSSTGRQRIELFPPFRGIKAIRDSHLTNLLLS